MCIRADRETETGSAHGARGFQVKPIIDAYIQARMAATRLPRKMIYRIGYATVLDHVIDRVKQWKGIRNIVLLTTPNDEDNVLAVTAQQRGIQVLRTDPPIERFLSACAKYRPDWFFRVCADSPFMSKEMTDRLIDSVSDDVGYIAYSEDGETPDASGLAPELVRASAFVGRSGSVVEHVTPHMYNKSRVAFLTKPEGTDFTVTLDTSEDFEELKRIFEGIGHAPEWNEIRDFKKAKEVTSKIGTDRLYYVDDPVTPDSQPIDINKPELGSSHGPVTVDQELHGK
jgi:spore coat polysaccharide biosynthesis protein SpsF (cytidylyltransferase family)